MNIGFPDSVESRPGLSEECSGVTLSNVDGMLESAIGLSEEERLYLASLNLSANQMSAVLQLLEHSYLSMAFRDANKNCRNLRVAVCGKRKLVAAYMSRQVESMGDCLQRDTKFHVSDTPGRREVVMVGFDHD